MTFASPAWLLLLVLAGVIAFLHSRPRRNVDVGSLFLWRQLELAVPPKATSKLPVPNLLLLLQLLALALIALALARPVRGGGEAPVDHWIVLLDASASMDATVDGSSAFDEARNYLESRLENAGRPPARLSLVSVGASPVVEAARLTRAESLLDAFDALTPSHTGADWTRVPAMLRGLTPAGERTRVTVLTDGPGRAAVEATLGTATGPATPAALETSAAVGSAGATSATDGIAPPGAPAVDLELVTFGAPAVNLALNAVEPTLLDPTTGLWRISGEIHRSGPVSTAGSDPVAVRILFEPATGVVAPPRAVSESDAAPSTARDPSPVSGPVEWTTFDVALDATGAGRFDQTIALPGAGLLEVRLPEDALAPDNSRLFVLHDAPRTARVLYIGPGDPDLLLALDAVPGVALTRAAALRGAAARFDLVLFDGVSNVESTGTNTVWLGAAAGIPEPATPAFLADPAPGGWLENHPLSGSVDWGSLAIRDARELPLLPGAVAVVEAPGGHPLVQARTTEAGREVVLAFRIGDTDWPEQLGFPAFVSNLLLWSVPDLGLAIEPPCVAGAPCPLGPPRLSGDWRLISPLGTEIRLPAAAASGANTIDEFNLRSTFTPTESGVYRLVSEGATRLIAVNAAIASEADLSAPDPAGSTDRIPDDARAAALPPIHGWLLALALVALLAEAWLAGRRGERFLQLQALRSDNPLANRRRTVLALRIGAVALLLLAILDPRTPVPTRTAGAVLVVDEAAAPGARATADAFITDAAGAANRNRRLGTVRVGAEGQVTADLGSASAAAPVQPAESAGAPPAADLESALRLATAMLPHETAGRIAVIGDGVETRGSVAAALPEILARGIPVDVHLRTDPSRDVAVETLSLHSAVHPNVRSPLRTTIRSSVATTASLQLLREGEVQAERIVDLLPGSNRVDFEISEESTGDFLYEVELAATEGDSRPANDRGGILVEVREPPRVAIVTPQPAWGQSFANALALQGLSAEVFPPSRTPAAAGGDTPSLADFDAVALMNVPAADLADDRASELETWVREGGGGLVLMGGENTFGPGGYFDSPLETLSPLSAKIPQELPNLAIIFVLDRSSSMGESVGQGTRLDIVKVATLDAIDLLDPETQVGVVAFDLNAYSVVPLQPAGNREAIREQIERLETGGGTWIYTGLGLGFVELSRVDPDFRRHLVLMSDGRSQPANYQLLMGLISDAGMTVSTAAIGSGADVRLMEELARLGGGAAHATNDFQDLPSILAREASRFSSSAVREESFEPTLMGDDAAGDAPFRDGPSALGGVVRTTLKPGAQVHLEAGEDIPLLASWRYGLGRVVAFASQGAGAWTTEWMESPEYSTWWAQTVRWALPSARTGLNLRLSRDRDYGRILVERVGGEPDADGGLPLEANVRAPDGTALATVRLTERSPGVYEARFVADLPGTWVVEVASFGAGASADVESVEGRLHVSYPARMAPAEPDEALLVALASATGGRVLTSGQELFDSPTPFRWTGRSAWPFWAVLALGAFLLELLFRYTTIAGRLARPWVALRTRGGAGR